MSFTYFAHGVADLGKERLALEDCVRVEHLPQGGVVAIVCDGMGGAEGGAIAARTAMLSLVDAVRSQTAEATPAALRDALLDAHLAVVESARRSGIPGMGTTAVVAWCEGGSCFVGWVGDSRMYLWRGANLFIRTTDHSRVAELVAQGQIRPEEVANHPQAHVLAQALGGDHGVVPGVYEPIAVQRGDAILLCSDGLYDMLNDAEIGALLVGQSYGDAVHALVDEANRRGGNDNIGVAVIVVGERRIAGSRAGQ